MNPPCRATGMCNSDTTLTIVEVSRPVRKNNPNSFLADRIDLPMEDNRFTMQFTPNRRDNPSDGTNNTAPVTSDPADLLAYVLRS